MNKLLKYFFLLTIILVMIISSFIVFAKSFPDTTNVDNLGSTAITFYLTECRDFPPENQTLCIWVKSLFPYTVLFGIVFVAYLIFRNPDKTVANVLRSLLNVFLSKGTD